MAQEASIQLYQFPISHYCEKVRWALNYKGLPYKRINCLPGLHSRTTKKIAKNSSVPVLQHGKNVIQGSSDILDYLEAQFPDKPLDFSDQASTDEAKEWENFADKQIGPHVRRIMYHQLLNHPKIVVPIFSHDGPWYSPLYFKATYPKLTHIMRKLMHINDKEVEESKVILNKAISRLKEQLSLSAATESAYLVGERFSRADLSVAALLAPLFLPKEYGINWPTQFPSDVEAVITEYQSHKAVSFAKELYAKHRTN